MGKTVEIGAVRPDENNPRRKVDADKVAFKELQASIASSGIVQPIVVRPDGDDGFIVIAGHRRLAAAEALGMELVPIDIRPNMTDQQIVEFQLIENLQREDLDPVEEATGYFRLVELGMKQEELAKRVGRPKPHVAARIKMLRLPAGILALVKKGDIGVGDANELLRIEDRDLLKQAAALVVKDGMNPQRAADSVLADVAAEAEMARIMKLVTENGWSVHQQEGWEVDAEVKKWRELRGYEGLGLTDDQVIEHRKAGELHGVLIKVGYGGVKGIECSTNPSATKKLLGLKTTRSEVDEAERERRRREREEIKHRREFISSVLLKGRPKVSSSMILEQALDASLESVDDKTCDLAAELLGHEKPKAKERPFNWGRQIIREMAKDATTPTIQRLFMAVRAARAETWRSTSSFTEAVLRPAGFVDIEWDAADGD